MPEQNQSHDEHPWEREFFEHHPDLIQRGPMTPDPLPPFKKGLVGNWGQMIITNFLDQQERMMRRYDMAAGIDPDNRPTTSEERPLAAQYLADRADFERRWSALVAEGENEGYLTREHCYECAGEYKVADETTEWATIPNPAFDPAKPNPYRKDA